MSSYVEELAESLADEWYVYGDDESPEKRQEFVSDVSDRIRRAAAADDATGIAELQGKLATVEEQRDDWKELYFAMAGRHQPPESSEDP